MVSAYRAGYITDRVVTRMVKVYFASKILNKAAKQVGKVAKSHKINSESAEVEIPMDDVKELKQLAKSLLLKLHEESKHLTMLVISLLASTVVAEPVMVKLLVDQFRD